MSPLSQVSEKKCSAHRCFTTEKSEKSKSRTREAASMQSSATAKAFPGQAGKITVVELVNLEVWQKKKEEEGVRERPVLKVRSY